MPSSWSDGAFEVLLAAIGDGAREFAKVRDEEKRAAQAHLAAAKGRFRGEGVRIRKDGELASRRKSGTASSPP